MPITTIQSQIVHGPMRIMLRTPTLASWATAAGRNATFDLEHSRQRVPAGLMTTHLWQMGRPHLPQRKFVGSLGCLGQNSSAASTCV